MARGDGDDGDNIIGPRLRALRDRLGLSQRALARKAGVPSSTVSLVESGRTSPSVGSLKKLAGIATRVSRTTGMLLTTGEFSSGTPMIQNAAFAPGCVPLPK